MDEENVTDMHCPDTASGDDKQRINSVRTVALYGYE